MFGENLYDAVAKFVLVVPSKLQNDLERELVVGNLEGVRELHSKTLLAGFIGFLYQRVE